MWATESFVSALKNEIMAQDMLNRMIASGHGFSDLSPSDQNFYRASDTAWSQAFQAIPTSDVNAVASQADLDVKMIQACLAQ